MMLRIVRNIFCMLAVVALLIPQQAHACPFCGGVMMTLTDEMKASEVVVIARISAEDAAKQEAELEAREAQANAGADPAASAFGFAAEVPKTKFDVIEVVKGQDILGDAKQVELLYFGNEPAERQFLIQGTRIPMLNWGTPLALSDRGVEYVRKLPTLPESGPERLAFFQEHFEDAEELLARDAYDEFAKAPYEEVKLLKDQMHHDKLVAWIKDPKVSVSHRRLYLTLLGVCGRDPVDPADVAMLEEMIKAEADEPKPALDATVACYLTLVGVDGMPLVEQEFLKNKKCPYTDTYAAIMALRFHGQEEQIIPRERVLAGLRHLLDRPELADLVVADLARWQDWSAMDQLVNLFKDADEKSSWVRVPVVQYLRACPLPEAKKHLEDLAKIDPEAVQRASLFVPLGGGQKPVPPPVKEEAAEAGKTETQPAANDAAQIDGDLDDATSDGGAQAEDEQANAAGTVSTGLNGPQGPAGEAVAIGAAATSGAAVAKSQTADAAAKSRGDENRSESAAGITWMMIFFPAVIGLIIAGLLYIIIRGGRRVTSQVNG